MWRRVLGLVTNNASPGWLGRAIRHRSLNDILKQMNKSLNACTVGPVTTRNEATPGNEAKKTLPENVANFVGGYIFWEPHTQK